MMNQCCTQPYSISEIKSINNIESERVKVGWIET